MAIIPIANQPLSFVPTQLDGCLCTDPTDVLLVEPNDTIQFQVIADPCLGEQLIASPNFEDATDWLTGGFDIRLGSACPEVDNATLKEDTFVPTIGVTYYLQITLSGGDGTYRGYFAGENFGPMVGGHGNQFIITATTIEPLILEFTPSTRLPLRRACVEQVNLYVFGSDILVELLDSAGLVVDDFDVTEHPERFTYDRDSVTISYPLSDVPYLSGCGYSIRVIDQCDDVGLDSQAINVVDGSCSLLFTVCNTTDFGGFYIDNSGFSPQIRVLAKLTHPAYDYDIAEERLSNGRLNRYYADRRRKMELRIDRVGESAHRFLSTIPVWDHFYIGQDEYVMGADEYVPGYEDVYEAYGGIIRTVVPRQELMRKVRCGEESAGCVPPPNYHVQGTGPNTDYIIQEENGDRILIAE